jgi:hypothetical protein
MAMVQLPFIIATAGKNNVLSFLTGISHEKVCSTGSRSAGMLIYDHRS